MAEKPAISADINQCADQFLITLPLDLHFSDIVNALHSFFFFCEHTISSSFSLASPLLMTWLLLRVSCWAEKHFRNTPSTWSLQWNTFFALWILQGSIIKAAKVFSHKMELTTGIKQNCNVLIWMSTYR